MSKKFVFLFFLISFFLRLAFLIAFGNYTRVAERYDATDLKAIGKNLASGKGFLGLNGKPTMARPPVYPLFLAAIYKVFRGSDFAVKIFQDLFDSLRVVLLLFIAYEIFGIQTAFILGLISVVYVPYILYSNIILTESLFSFFLALLCFLLIIALKREKIRDFIYAGISFGVATLTRGVSLFFPFFLFPLLIWKFGKKFLKGFAIFFLVGYSVVGVWTARNYAVFKSFIPVSTGGGGLVWLATQKNAWKGDVLVELKPLDMDYFKDLRGLPWYEWEKIVARRTMAWALRHPLTYGSILFRNFLRLWSIPVGKVSLARKSGIAGRLYKIFFIFSVFIALFGILRGLLYPDAGAFIVFLFLVYVSLMHSIVLPLPRYRLPFEQFMLVFFSFGLWRIYLYIRSSKRRR